MLHLSLLQPALRFCLAPLWPSKTKQDRDSGPQQRAWDLAT